MVTIEQAPDLLKETSDAIVINLNSQYILDNVILSLVEIKKTPSIFKKNY